MTFCATRYENEVPQAVCFEAESWSDAEKICETIGWCLEGVLVAEIPADKMSVPEAIELVDKLNSNKMDS